MSMDIEQSGKGEDRGLELMAKGWFIEKKLK